MASPDWNGQDKTAVSFGKGGRTVTPSDSTLLDPYAKAVVVTSIAGGDSLSILTVNGSTHAFVGVSVGFIPPYQVSRVNSTGTTCSVATID